MGKEGCELMAELNWGLVIGEVALFIALLALAAAIYFGLVGFRRKDRGGDC